MKQTLQRVVIQSSGLEMNTLLNSAVEVYSKLPKRQALRHIKESSGCLAHAQSLRYFSQAYHTALYGLQDHEINQAGAVIP